MKPEDYAGLAALDLEQALLGALLERNAALDHCTGLRPEDFAHPAHGRIFEAIRQSITAGKQASGKTLRHLFEADPDLQDDGKGGYLLRLQGAALVGIFNVRDYARIILDHSMRRRLLEFGADVAERARDTSSLEDSATQIAERALGELTAITSAAATSDGGGPRTAAEVGGEAAAEVEDALRRRMSGVMPGISTGLPSLDALTGGLRDGDLVILAGRPGMGKTALAEGFAWAAAHAGEGTLFVSAEMRAPQLLKRQAARVLGIPLNDLDRGKVSDDEFSRLMKMVRDLRDVPLRFLDRNANRTASVIAYARQLARKGKLRLIVADYLQRLDPLRKRERRDQEIGDLTGAAKNLALELGLPFVLLSQISRANEDRDNKMPRLTDLRESGNIEQDADVVIFAHRQHYYDQRDEQVQRIGEKVEHFTARLADWQAKCARSEGRGTLIIDKMRQGATGKVELLWDGPLVRYHDPLAAAPKTEEESLWTR